LPSTYDYWINPIQFSRYFLVCGWREIGRGFALVRAVQVGNKIKKADELSYCFKAFQSVTAHITLCEVFKDNRVSFPIHNKPDDSVTG
jgi:hypothetical protein